MSQYIYVLSGDIQSDQAYIGVEASSISVSDAFCSSSVKDLYRKTRQGLI